MDRSGQGKSVGGSSKTTLYVGGLAQEVSEDILLAAMIPFGEVLFVSIPKDLEGKHRSYGFVEFEDADDAGHAIDNMNGAELFGRVLQVNLSRQGDRSHAGKIDASSLSSGEHTDKYKPVWYYNTDEYVKLLEESSMRKKMADESQARQILQKAQDLARRPIGPTKSTQP